MISTKEKKDLKYRGNRIRATVSIGKAGLTPDFMKFIGEAFSNTDLIKLKIQRSFPGDRKSLAETLDQIDNIDVIQVVGNTILLYRPLAETAQ